MARKSKGRQKINMVKMQNESHLQVTFSKRRNGLFKKANELCVLCAAEVALIVFSPGQRAYSFGHPSVGSIIDKYLERKQSSAASNDATEACVNAKIHELNKQLSHLERLLEAEKKRGEVLDQLTKNDQRKQWWKAPIGELNLAQLKQLHKALEGLKKNVDIESRARAVQEANLSRYLLERGRFGRNNVGPSNVMDASFVVDRTSGPSNAKRFSPFVSKKIESPAKDIDLNRGASGSSFSNFDMPMPDGCEDGHVHKFF